ncbi:DNA gyrase subunit A [Methanosphaerula palustris]|uniref:DNA gyrase subunit A n=1 Tax=Methanosphaerula palustris (strain ATCC BAA-1556 / DSM 19958 / E1-9c) TaxID=521011 RepID=B8GGZ1_METPE|nr:DNA gyrase subunit A [Methanosphaerula palustris]ACL16396.1 DNA gyrase, A subunit [Methanosphaerula palustris E1-9c]
MTSEPVVEKIIPKVIPVNIEDEMKSSYIDYAMSVIIGRAIPDIRDGLKPVHRRTLYAMWEEGNTSDKAYKKSARAVAGTMGKYHPHGDASIYDTLVKMAQPFSYRIPLVDGQGNFGSIDGDSAAAMRYTEARLTRYAEELLADLDKKTVDFTPNFDSSTEEPTVLPSKVPNLLVNGTSGIAVGMATNMPPHNLREVCSAVEMTIKNPDCTVEDLMQVMPGPDFPTGGLITGTEGIVSAYHTGYGKLTVRGVAEIEDVETKTPKIIISEIPYQVNKARMVELIATLVKEKKIEGISDLRDESDRDGLRVVVDLKKGVIPTVVLNQLYKHTPLESTFGIINLAISDNQPKVLGLKAIISEFLHHRATVVRRRCEFDLKKAKDRLHILLGLLVALDRIDEVIATIRQSASSEAAQKALIATFGLTEPQTVAILQMQLRRLAALEQAKIRDERDSLAHVIAELERILSCEANIYEEIRKEIVDVGERYGDDRRTEITCSQTILEREDLIEDKPVLISITTQNYIKRLPLETYRMQRRGGRGVIGMATKDEDSVEDIFVASMHDYLLCFTTDGRVYWLKVYNIPEASRTSKGKAIVNLLELQDELITAVIPIRTFRHDRYLLFSTEQGQVVKVPQDQFSRPRSTGINAISLRENDSLVDVKLTDGTKELILSTRKGQSLRFHEQTVRTVGRNASGVRGIKLKYGDLVQAATVVEKDHLLTITELGYGKRTEFDEFRGHGRGTMGVRNILTAPQNGVVATKAVSSDDEIVVMSALGNVIRMKVSDISVQKRSARGVRIIRLDEDDRVVGLAVLQQEILSASFDDEAEEPVVNDPDVEEQSLLDL